METVTMETVTLKNGTEEAMPLVTVTMFSLQDLGKKSPLAVYELVMLCRDREHKIFSLRLADDLKGRSLIQLDGRVHASIKNIVLSAATGDGLDMVIGSPLA